jgi:chemotaxis protein methyltransferase CheR
VRPALAGRVRFKRHHLLDDPVPGRFDLILCRNVMLYFNAERRRRAFDRLADALVPDGYLMLGAGETVIGQTDRFGSDPELRGLYRPASLIRRQAA